MEGTKKVKAIYDYEATTPLELSIVVDEILTVSIEDSNEDWYYGSNNEGEGFFPANYVRDTPYPGLSQFGSQRSLNSHHNEDHSYHTSTDTSMDPSINSRENFVETSVKQFSQRIPARHISKSVGNLGHIKSFGSQRSIDSYSSEDYTYKVPRQVKKSLPVPAMRKSTYHFASTSKQSNCNLRSFSGINDNLTIDEWISLYEFGRAQDTNEEKVRNLMNYLSEKALSWYVQEVAKKTPPITWNDCKQRMLARFGANIERPLIVAIYRKFRENDSVEKYYSEKMTLLNQTNLPDIDKIALLTDGVPKHYQKSLVSTQISTPDQWFIIASRIEAMNSDLSNHLRIMPIPEENATDIPPIPSNDTQPRKWGWF